MLTSPLVPFSPCFRLRTNSTVSPPLRPSLRSRPRRLSRSQSRSVSFFLLLPFLPPQTRQSPCRLEPFLPFRQLNHPFRPPYSAPPTLIMEVNLVLWARGAEGREIRRRTGEGPAASMRRSKGWGASLDRDKPKRPPSTTLASEPPSKVVGNGLGGRKGSGEDWVVDLCLEVSSLLTRSSLGGCRFPFSPPTPSHPTSSPHHPSTLAATLLYSDTRNPHSPAFLRCQAERARHQGSGPRWRTRKGTLRQRFPGWSSHDQLVRFLSFPDYYLL